MPKVSVALAELDRDPRSDEVTYKLSIENRAAGPIKVLSINPQIPDTARLVRITDQSLEGERLRHQQLCVELTGIAFEHLISTSNEMKDLAKRERRREWLVAVDGVLSAALRIVLPVLPLASISANRSVDAGMDASAFPLIRNHADAKLVWDKWFTGENATNALGQMYDVKMNQLSLVEEKLNRYDVLATIDPEGTFTMTFVLRLKRGFIDARRVSFAVGVVYAESEQQERTTDVAAAALTVSPRPAMLNSLAILGGALGVVLRFAIDNGGKSTGREFLSGLGKQFISSPGISAAILSVLLVNIYEFTDFKDRIKLALGWRSAILMGVISGIIGERVVAALKAFAGT